MDHDLSRRFAVNGVDLAWDRWGPADDATPLVLCHGFSGSAQDFAGHVDSLAVGRPVIAIDHRGHGRSTKLRDAAGYSLGQIVSDLIAFLDAIVGVPVDLLGHSMGGAVGVRVTLERPDLVRSLIMMDTSAWSFRSDDDAQVAFLTRFLASYDPAAGLPDGRDLNPVEDALIAASIPEEWREARDLLAAEFDPYALKALGEELFAGDMSVRDRLGEIVCPVTVIVGADDQPFAAQAPALAAEVADGEMVAIDEAFHSPQLTHPEVWRAAVLDHLAGVDARAKRR